jgi:hypothetical protein
VISKCCCRWVILEEPGKLVILVLIIGLRSQPCWLLLWQLLLLVVNHKLGWVMWGQLH